MNLTLAITNYNRYEMLLESFANVINDKRIDEILIMDDHSEDKYWNKIKDLDKFNPKIKVVRQLFNRGMSENKRDAIACAKNEWVIIFDSDNVIGKEYLNAVDGIELWPTIICCPSFAKPNFDYRKFNGKVFDIMLKNIDLSDSILNCLFNTCNYLVNRDNYLKVWKENTTVGCADTVWFNYLWLKEGCGFYVVPGMEYQHRVHAGSGFLQDVDNNMKQAEKIKQLIREL